MPGPIFLIGGNGFVGSAYARLFAERGLEFRLVTRENAEHLAGQPCDILINANGNSKKFMADREPLWEFDASTRSVAVALDMFKPRLCVHLSTGDVYPDQSSPEVTGEDQVIDVARLSRYGLHKYLAELLVRGTQEQWLILRMGGFVGQGLKKNAVFDMLNGAPVWLAPDSELQFIATDNAARVVWSMVESGVANEVVNLGAEGVVQLGWLHAQMRSRSSFKSDAKIIRFELSTEKLRRLSTAPLPRAADDVLSFVSAAGSRPLDEGI